MRRFYAVLLLACSLPFAAPSGAQTVVGSDSLWSRYDPAPHRPAAPTRPEIFQTGAIGAGVTLYDARFRRVATTDATHPKVLAIARRLEGLDLDAKLRTAQSEVLNRVRWSHDLDNMRVGDFWSNAGETLERGTGDSEDIAIVTMQVLKAAGVSARDLYLSVGRSPRVGAHVVLIARTEQGFVVLDDKIGQPVPASDRAHFVPVITVGQGKSWVHGRRVTGATARMSAR